MVAEIKSSEDKQDRKHRIEVKEICDRCSGTGLVCGCIPVISPGCCCVDYYNAICPVCNGNGVREA